MMAGSRRFYLSLVILFVVLTVTFYFAFQITTSTQPQNVSSMMTAREPTNTPDVTATIVAQQTISFERTAIARFTQYPTLALSSTPYFAVIVHNEMIRQITETPAWYYPTQLAQYRAELTAIALTTSPTPLPTLNVTGYPTVTPSFIRHCSPVGSNWTQSEQSQRLSALLGEQIPNVSVVVFSFGIDGIDQACLIPFQPISSRISVGIPVEDTVDRTFLVSSTTQVVEFLAAQWDSMEYVSHLSTSLRIWFDVPNSQYPIYYIWTDMLVALQAYNDGLRGEPLVEALGGLIEGE